MESTVVKIVENRGLWCVKWQRWANGAGIATLIVGAPEPHFVAAGIKGIATAFPLQRILGRDRGPVASHRDFVVFVLNLNLPIFCMKHNCS